MTNVPVPSTRAIQATRKELQQTGTIWRCIQAGFIKGLINDEQATDIQSRLTTIVDYCQEQQTIIFQLQTELAKVQQLTLCNPSN